MVVKRTMAAKIKDPSSSCLPSSSSSSSSSCSLRRPRREEEIAEDQVVGVAGRARWLDPCSCIRPSEDTSDVKAARNTHTLKKPRSFALFQVRPKSRLRGHFYIFTKKTICNSA